MEEKNVDSSSTNLFYLNVDHLHHYSICEFACITVDFEYAQNLLQYDLNSRENNLHHKICPKDYYERVRDKIIESQVSDNAYFEIFHRGAKRYSSPE